MASDYAREIHGGMVSECGECGRANCGGHPEMFMADAEAYARGAECAPWLTPAEAIAQAHEQAAELIAARLELLPRGPSRAGSYGDNGGIIDDDDDDDAVGWSPDMYMPNA